MTSRSTALQYLAAEAELSRRITACPLAYFDPHVGQSRAIELTKGARVTVMCAGNRWGKSHVNAALIMAYMYGYYIWEVPDLKLTEEGDYPPRNRIDPKYWVKRPDGVPLEHPSCILLVTGLKLERGIAQILFPKIESFLPPAVRARWEVKRGQHSVPFRFTLPNGSVCHFGSAEQAPMQFEGTAYHAAGFDEPPTKPIFQAVWRGLTDHFAPCWFSMTPIGANAPWVYQDLVAAADRTDVASIQGSIWDNPHISDRAKKEFLDGGAFNEDERRARETGAWVFLSHVAFPQWDPAIHVVPSGRIDPDWIRLVSVDPHHRRPYAMGWYAFGPNGEVEIYNEWPLGQEHHKIRSSSFTVRDYATTIRDMEGRNVADCRVLDPRFGKAEFSIKGEVQTSVQEDFADLGLYFDFPRRGIGREETGILELRDLLAYNKALGLSPTNQPKLHVQAHCINHMLAFERSNFKPADLREPDILREELKEAYKDFRDVARYAILADRPWQRDDGTGHEYLTEDALEEANDPWNL